MSTETLPWGSTSATPPGFDFVGDDTFRPEPHKPKPVPGFPEALPSSQGHAWATDWVAEAVQEPGSSLKSQRLAQFPTRLHGGLDSDWAAEWMKGEGSCCGSCADGGEFEGGGDKGCGCGKGGGSSWSGKAASHVFSRRIEAVIGEGHRSLATCGIDRSDCTGGWTPDVGLEPKHPLVPWEPWNPRVDPCPCMGTYAKFTGHFNQLRAADPSLSGRGMECRDGNNWLRLIYDGRDTYEACLRSYKREGVDISTCPPAPALPALKKCPRRVTNCCEWLDGEHPDAEAFYKCLGFEAGDHGCCELTGMIIDAVAGCSENYNEFAKRLYNASGDKQLDLILDCYRRPVDWRKFGFWPDALDHNGKQNLRHYAAALRYGPQVAVGYAVFQDLIREHLLGSQVGGSSNLQASEDFGEYRAGVLGALAVAELERRGLDQESGLIWRAVGSELPGALWRKYYCAKEVH